MFEEKHKRVLLAQGKKRATQNIAGMIGIPVLMGLLQSKFDIRKLCCAFQINQRFGVVGQGIGIAGTHLVFGALRVE